jgi:hypothetical protein
VALKGGSWKGRESTKSGHAVFCNLFGCDIFCVEFVELKDTRVSGVFWSTCVVSGRQVDDWCVMLQRFDFVYPVGL